MNGRLYDPVLGRILSPDPYIQLPGFAQNYNRYSYVWNNPLMYSDPDGEFIFMAAAIIGAGIGIWQGYKMGVEKGASGWGMAGYMLGGGVVGVVGGVASAGVGVYIGGAVGLAGLSGFSAGAITGAASGLVGGAINGFGMTALGGGSFGESMLSAGKGALIGLATGAILGGTFEGVRAFRDGRNFWNGKPTTTSIENSTVSLPKLEDPEIRLENPIQRGDVIDVSDDLRVSSDSKNNFKIKANKIAYSENTDGIKLTIARDQIKGYHPSLETKTNLYHNFPRSMDNQIIQSGTWGQRIKDAANWYEAVGEINGVKGVYQIGINDNGIIFHRCFIPF